MRIEFTGRHTPVPQAFQEHVEKRLEKLERLNHKVTGIHVVLAEVRGRADVEITVDLDGTPVRSEVKGPDPRASFDSALEKLERQIGKFKARWDTRVRKLRRAAVEVEGEAAQEPETEEEPGAEDEPQIVRTKSVSLKPMAPEEAALQMELLGHDFFLFRNSDSDLVSVVYKRQTGGYGLIECEA